MVHGLDAFKRHFGDRLGRYVIIGGTACNLIYARYGLEERATHDIDMIIVAEAFDREFYELFRDFIISGGYQHRGKIGTYQLYRFDKPSDSEFPKQIELLSRRPEYLEGIETQLGRFKVIDAGGSLSAIMLDDEYYSLLQDGIEHLDGLPILAHKYLPIFKIHAWVNLTADKDAGKTIHSDEIRKHCRDVLKLCSLFDDEARFPLPESIANEVSAFVEKRPWDDNMLRNLRLDMTANEMAGHIASIYGCSGSV